MVQDYPLLEENGSYGTTSVRKGVNNKMIIGNPTAIAKVAPNAESWSATYSRMRTFVTL